MKKVAIGGDHAGFPLKKTIIDYMKSKGFEVEDFGTYSEERTDYPDFAHKVSEAVLGGGFEFGVLICGSANGISMAANKHRGIRAAICWNREIAELARLHNDANILSMPGRFIDTEEAKACVDAFSSTAFEGGRHEGRVNKINC